MVSRKLILGFLFFIYCFQLKAQCDIQLHQCYNEIKNSVPAYLFFENALEKKPYKFTVYLHEGHFYNVHYCTAQGLGPVIIGLQEINGTLIRNNIVNSEELKKSFDWYCKKSGIYYLIFWLEEGSGCTAVQISVNNTQFPVNMLKNN